MDTILPGHWTQSFIPHGYCFSWNPLLLWTFVAADTIIAFSYFSIPFTLWYFIQRRPDISQRWLVALFAFFIVACGITHIFDVLTIWQPMYWLNAAAKAVTATISFITAIALWRIMPLALKAPSLQQLEEANNKLAESHAALELRVRERTAELAQSEEQLRAVLDGAELGFWDWNIVTGEVARNERWATMLGYTSREIAHTTLQWTDFIYPDDRDFAWQSINDVLEGRSQVHKIEYRMLHKDGSIRWVSDHANVMQRDAGGNPIRMSGIHSDITERKQVDEAISESNQRFRSILDNLFAYVALLDTNGVVQEINKAPLERAGYRREEVVGRYFYDVPWWNYDDQVREQLITAINAAKQGNTSRYDITAKMGNDLVPLDFLITPVQDNSGRIVGLLPTAVDITERKRLEEELQRQAHMDYLTGLPNRRSFMDRGEIELARILRYESPLSILMLDIDHFKKINDTYGHQSGDLVLASVASTFQEVLRNVDISGRLGGEEFAVILPETGIEKATEVAERLREIISADKVTLTDGIEINYTVSIGVATLIEKTSNINMLLNEADKALYKAKQTGRNRVCS